MRESRRVGRSEISSVIMGIEELHPQLNWVLRIVADDGRVGNFDVSTYLEYEAFNELQDKKSGMLCRRADKARCSGDRAVVTDGPEVARTRSWNVVAIRNWHWNLNWKIDNTSEASYLE